MKSPGALKSPAAVTIGVVMTLLGLVFMFQGLGVIHGSSMTNSDFWAVAGPLIAIAGLVLIVRGARRSATSRTP